jgi:hypothetical protein
MPKYEHRAGQPDKTIAKGSSTSPDIFEGWTLRFAEMPPREKGLQIKVAQANVNLVVSQQILTNLYGKKDTVHSFTKRKSFGNLLLLGAIFDQSFVACNLLHTLQ